MVRIYLSPEMAPLCQKEDKNSIVDVYAQRPDAAIGAEIGENDIRVSHTGTFGTIYPVVTYNDTMEEYIVSWSDGLDCCYGTGQQNKTEEQPRRCSIFHPTSLAHYCFPK